MTAAPDATTGVDKISAYTLLQYAAGRRDAEQSDLRWLDGHGPAWAAAYAILAERSMRLRPEWRRDAWKTWMRADFRIHCLPEYELVAAAVADVPVDAPLRPLLDDAAWLARIPSLPMEERLATRSRQVPPTPWRTDDARERD